MKEIVAVRYLSPGRCADSLINELKRPKGYKEMFGLTDKTK